MPWGSYLYESTNAKKTFLASLKTSVYSIVFPAVNSLEQPAQVYPCYSYIPGTGQLPGIPRASDASFLVFWAAVPPSPGYFVVDFQPADPVAVMVSWTASGYLGIFVV